MEREKFKDWRQRSWLVSMPTCRTGEGHGRRRRKSDSTRLGS